MRDAFGGAFMIKIFLIFIFVYIFFTAIALNYAKAFKVKNKVIEYLETHEITDLNEMTAIAEDEMEKYFDEEILGNMNYRVNNSNICAGISTEIEGGRRVAYCNPMGIVIRQAGKDVKTGGVYYTVSTYIGWDIGFFNILSSADNSGQDSDNITGMWKISGQTKLIVKES